MVMAFWYNGTHSFNLPCQTTTTKIKGNLKYAGAYLKKMTAYLQMTAYLRVPHLFEIDHGFETPIALPLTARHHGGFSQELAWAL